MRILLGCLSSVVLVFVISSLSGEDLLTNNKEINDGEILFNQIKAQLDGGIAHRLAQLGEAPEREPFRKAYAMELANEIQELASLTEKQRMLFDAYNVRNFESQLKRMIGDAQQSDVQSLMDELDVVRRELRNSANLIEKRRSTLIRQRTAYIVLFLIIWIVLYLYYSQGILSTRSD